MSWGAILSFPVASGNDFKPRANFSGRLRACGPPGWRAVNGEIMSFRLPVAGRFSPRFISGAILCARPLPGLDHNPLERRMNACRNRPFHQAVGAPCRRARKRSAACGDTANHTPCRRRTPNAEADFERTVAALESEAVRRALSGVAVPVFHQGRECGSTVKHSDQLLMFLLKTLKPSRYAGGKNATPAAPAGPERAFALEIDLAAAGDGPALEEPDEGESEGEDEGEDVEAKQGEEKEAKKVGSLGASTEGGGKRRRPGPSGRPAGSGEGSAVRLLRPRPAFGPQPVGPEIPLRAGPRHAPRIRCPDRGGTVHAGDVSRKGGAPQGSCPLRLHPAPSAPGRWCGLPGLAVPVQGKRRQHGQGRRQRGEAVGQGPFGPA